MAKCDLAIQLDEPERVYLGGETITGVVHVRADDDVQCKGLEIKSAWKTHGRGNVTQGESGSVVLFQGSWQGGDKNEYRFSLPIGHWPPTYHGFHLNIEHSIDARAKISWSVDPKASVPFTMQPVRVDDTVGARSTVQLTGPLAVVVGGIFVASFVSIFGLVLWNIGPVGLIFLGLPVFALIVFGFYRWMPRWVLGDVRCELSPPRVHPGGSVNGEVVVRPGRRVAIGGVTATIEGIEKCVSGSGSNRTTHRHTFFRETRSLAEASTLAAAVEQRFPIEFGLPADAAYSVDLSDNDLIWSANIVISLPRWPDWKKTIEFQVVPDLKAARELRSANSTGDDQTVHDQASGESDEITFAETVRHLWAVREDRDDAEMLVEAVMGLSFDIQAIIERRLLYAGDDDRHVRGDRVAVWARYPDPELPMVLYVSPELGDDFEQTGREVWQGRGTIVGWDRRHGRLQVRTT